jgi:hypothetical protein
VSVRTFDDCPVAECGERLVYDAGWGNGAQCLAGHEFTVYGAVGALKPKDADFLYIDQRELVDLIDFQAVFHNTCCRIDQPARFFGGIRELVRRLADRDDRRKAEQEARGDEQISIGNPMRRVDEDLAKRGYGIGYGGC